MVDHQAIFQKYGKALNDANLDDLTEVLTEDYSEEYPQSGEIVRGRANLLAIFRNYPGRTSDMPLGDVSTLKVKPADAYHAVAPTFAVVRVEGAGTTGVATIRATYPDGSKWWNIVFYTLRGDRISASRVYFAADFAAPDWRSKWVETVK
jgi:hypothetical protein